MDGDAQARARIMEHWRASGQGDSAAEHAIYTADAILDYPQSGERFRSATTAVPSHSVSIMEFSGGLVAHETQYFAGPFDPPRWRAALAGPMPGRSG